ncbi:F0F1 ATP synthase subunit B [Natronosporangium hydrolyticum]|uniref:ATP synthase subunit b n=1 Tax=Natronosporangium hydrolyticum TaxID=2811111 RepID=A0A895YSW7_9ACTN|nr:F0F1 ATP synthase subunit B [Natronosporangium hydrolyticum]QSB17128.1 F0F1 ATP synthase subunit B [Natronosporangium hydrolyticum]
MLWAAAGDPNPVLPHTSEIIVGLVAFLLLLFVIRKFVTPRFEKIYEERTEKIEGGLQRAEAAQAEANRLLEQYQTQLAEAKTEAARIRDDARADAEGIRNDVLAQAREESERIIAAGRDALAAERATLVRELRAEIGTLSVELASRIIGESLADEARRAGTVERFLSDLESAEQESPNGGAATAGAR